MKILVTGNEGFIGGRIVKALEMDHELYIFDSMDFFNDWEECCEPDVVIHCGAISNSGYVGPDIFKQNTEATRELGLFARKNKAKFIFLSSQLAYKPHNHYGWSKKYAEEALWSLAYTDNFNQDTCILRLPGVTGDEDFKKEGRNPSILTKVKSGELRFVIEGYRRRLINVEGVVNIILEVLARWRCGVFNIKVPEISIERMMRENGWKITGEQGTKRFLHKDHSFFGITSLTSDNDHTAYIPETIELDTNLQEIKP